MASHARTRLRWSFPLSLTDSERSRDARSVEFPLNSAARHASRHTREHASLTDSERSRDARSVEFPLNALRDAPRVTRENTPPVEFPP